MRSLSALFFAIIVCSGPASAEMIEFKTNVSILVNGDRANQGWWAPEGFGWYNNTINENIDMREESNNSFALLRTFYTFDLSSLAGTVVSAVLDLNQVNGKSWYSTNESTETIGFFDVTTDPYVLNYNQGKNTDIYNDLGSGTSYGIYTIQKGLGWNDKDAFELNSEALSAIQNATGGYFSIGGAILSGNGNDALLWETPQFVSLKIEIAPVPEPTTILLLATGLTALAGIRYRKSA